MFGSRRGEEIALAPVNTIGRDAACTIVCTDQTVSRRHAEICAENGAWMVRDLGSASGTLVNDNRVDRHALVDGEYIMVGRVIWRFRSP